MKSLKLSILMGILLISNISEASNSRIRHFKTCKTISKTADNSFDLEINYKVELHEECTKAPSPYELDCRESIDTSKIFLEDLTQCTKLSKPIEVNILTNENSKIVSITPLSIDWANRECAGVGNAIKQKNLICAVKKELNQSVTEEEYDCHSCDLKKIENVPLETTNDISGLAIPEYIDWKRLKREINRSNKRKKQEELRLRKSGKLIDDLDYSMPERSFYEKAFITFE